MTDTPERSAEMLLATTRQARETLHDFVAELAAQRAGWHRDTEQLIAKPRLTRQQQDELHRVMRRSRTLG